MKIGISLIGNHDYFLLPLSSYWLRSVFYLQIQEEQSEWKIRVVNLGSSIIVKMKALVESWKIISIVNFYFGSEDNLVSLENKT